MRSVPDAWRDALGHELAKPYYRDLRAFVDAERRAHDVFPSDELVFAALAHTPPDGVRVVIVGQDPYHDHGQAHGLAFSVANGARIPPSLRNIFRELRDDLGIAAPRAGDLSPWTRSGVLLLNTVLTVRAHAPASHRNRGWERFTDRVLAHVSRGRRRVVFLLWGAAAHAKRPLVDESVHAVISSAHPSPLSARRGFFGSRPFSRANALLDESGRAPIDWRLD